MITGKGTIPLVSLSFLCACHGGDDDPIFSAPPPASPPAGQAIGGIWRGIDTNAVNILALSTEDGRIHFIYDNGQQGFGIATVDDTAVTIEYTLVTTLTSILADGSRSAQCVSTGTIQERQSITMTTECGTTRGTKSTSSALLTYNNLYDRDSSLAAIAGTYNDFGSILTIDSNGILFEQDPLTGCVFNGQLSIIDASYNAYELIMDISACGDANRILNGATFSGIAMLDDTGNPETLIAGLTGDVAGAIVARSLEALSLDR